MPSRQPRWPSIGFDSLSSATRRAIASADTPSCLASLAAKSGCSCRWCSDKNSCRGGSSKRIVTGRPFISRNSPAKSSRWKGSSLASAFSRDSFVSATIISRNFVEVLEEHVLGAAQADPLGAEGDRRAAACVWLVGIRADPQLAVLVDPAHQLGVALIDFRFFGLLGLGEQHFHHFAGLGRHFPFVDFAGKAVDADPVARLERLAADEQRLFVVVDVRARRSRRCRLCPSAG